MEEAEKEYRTAIEKDPGFALAYSNLGGLLGGLGRQEDAEKEYRTAIEKDPSFAQAYYNLGVNIRLMYTTRSRLDVYRANACGWG